jgi:hypothetical protein
MRKIGGNGAIGENTVSADSADTAGNWKAKAVELRDCRTERERWKLI